MIQQLRYLPETPSQTAGPYVHIGLIPHQAGFDIFDKNFSNVLVADGTQGERIRIEGHVYRRLRLAGAGRAARDLAGQCGGQVQSPAPTGRTSRWTTAFAAGGDRDRISRPASTRSRRSSPAAVVGRAGKGSMAPHINFWIVARGINIGLNTRMYFGDEAEANAKDPVLRLIELEKRRSTLIAPREMRDGTAVYTFDIHLQGEEETVFLDV